MGPSKKCWFWGNGPAQKHPRSRLRHQKTFHLALFLSNLAILKSAALFQGLNWPPKAEKANWRSQLHAQRSQMHSIPLRLSEKNSFRAKAQRRRDMCDP